MVLAAGLIEGVTFFSLIVCILLAIKKQARHPHADCGSPHPGPVPAPCSSGCDGRVTGRLPIGADYSTLKLTGRQ
jgi:hypothetical protein